MGAEGRAWQWDQEQVLFAKAELSSTGLLLSRVKGTTWGGEVWSTKPRSLAQAGCTQTAKSLGSVSGLAHQTERSQTKGFFGAFSSKQGERF